MSDEQSEKSEVERLIGDIAPKLATLTDTVLFDDVWAGDVLSPRDRSMITVAALIVLGRTEQLSWHFPYALNNGVTAQELVEVVTHLAFYGGWPVAMSAITPLRTAIEEHDVVATDNQGSK